MSIEILKQEIESKELQRLKLKQRQYQRRNCIASDLGPCLKERYHAIVDWEKRPMPDLYLQARFEKGNEEENQIIRKLMENGFEIVEGQKQFSIKDRAGNTVITGKIDGKIKFQGKLYPFEVKSLNPNIYDNINVVEDFNKYGFFAKYPKQLNAYLFGENLEEGCFILTDCLGHSKVIPVKINLQDMETELANCTLVMGHVNMKRPPAFTQDKGLCRKCWAAKTCCFPPMDFGEGVQVIDDEELILALKRRDELDPLRSEYESIDKKVKERFKATSGLHAIAGNFEIEVTEKETKYKATAERTIKVVRVNIERIEGDNVKV